MGILRVNRTSPSTSTSPTSTSPCADLKTAYNNCFNRWYSEKFVKGQWQKEECVVEWEKYRECLSQHLEDKQLSRFLEVEASRIPSLAKQSNTKSSVDGAGASMGASSAKFQRLSIKKTRWESLSLNSSRYQKTT